MNRAILVVLLVFLQSCATAPKSKKTISVQQDVLFVTQLVDEKKASDDALLVSPITDDKTYLLNRRGEILHTWQSGMVTHHAKLGVDGRLYGLYRNPELNLRRVAGLLAVHSADGKMLWSYADPYLHHTLEPMPNGHILGIKFSPLPENQLRGSIQQSRLNPVCDEIVEVSPEGKVVWNLPLTDLIRVDQKYKGPADADLVPLLSLSSYCHSNSLRYYETNPLSGKPVVLISIRNLGLVLLIEKESKKLLWSSEGLPFVAQHDARLYGENMLLFNNNSGSGPHNNMLGPSEVLSIHLKSKKIERLFGQKDIMFQNWGSANMSGSSYLSNGNLLITISGYSQVWELTPSGQLVFKLSLISPKFLYELGSGLYTAEAYPLSFLRQNGLVN